MMDFGICLAIRETAVCVCICDPESLSLSALGSPNRQLTNLRQNE